MIRKRGERGFTLPELLVVVAIIGLFALVTIPSFRDFLNAFKIRTAAMQIRDTSRLGRQVAVAKKIFAVGIVDLDEETYRVWKDEDKDETKDPGEEYVKPEPVIGFGIDIVKVKANTSYEATSGTVEFVMETDGTIGRKGGAAAESQWCIFMKKQINSVRVDHWMIVIKLSGKITSRFKIDPTDACQG